jgi:cell division protein FtsW (lipid II flippase)
MAQLPEKRHNRRELQEMRNRNAFAVRPPVQQLQNQALAKPVLGFFYLLAFVAAGFVVYSFSSYVPVLELYFKAGFACAIAVMLMAVFIFWRKPRSRHHAAFLLIISLLVLVFGSVYYSEQFEQKPAHDDTQGPIRY